MFAKCSILHVNTVKFSKYANRYSVYRSVFPKKDTMKKELQCDVYSLYKVK